MQNLEINFLTVSRYYAYDKNSMKQSCGFVETVNDW